MTKETAQKMLQCVFTLIPGFACIYKQCELFTITILQDETEEVFEDHLCFTLKSLGVFLKLSDHYEISYSTKVL